MFCFIQLPVACKSCPCGHIFISRKLHQAQVKKEGKYDQILFARFDKFQPGFKPAPFDLESSILTIRPDMSPSSKQSYEDNGAFFSVVTFIVQLV